MPRALVATLFGAAVVRATSGLPPLAVSVDCGAVTAPLSRVWTSCGYSPAEIALRPDGAENNVRLGALPNRGIGQVRVHFMLDLLVVTAFTPPSSSLNASLTYDWTLLDAAVDGLVANRLSPGFELMGSPPG